MEFEFKVTQKGILLIANGEEIGLFKTMTEATSMADHIRETQSK